MPGQNSIMIYRLSHIMLRNKVGSQRVVCMPNCANIRENMNLKCICAFRGRSRCHPRFLWLSGRTKRFAARNRGFLSVRLITIGLEG